MAIDKGDNNESKGPSVGDAFRRAQAGGEQPQPQPGPGPAQRAAESEARPNPPEGRVGRAGVMNINGLMSRPMSRKSTGEIVVMFRDALEAQMERNFKSPQERDAWSLLVLDNNTAQVGPLSSILLCYTVAQQGELYSTVFTMLVEGSADGLSPMNINMQGRNVQLDTVAGDVFGPAYWEAIKHHVNNIYGKNVHVTDAGQEVLPKELDPEDDEHMRQVMFSAISACSTVMENVLDLSSEVIFNVGMIDQSSEKISARTAYLANDDPGSGQAETFTGLPVRSDIRVTLEASSNSQQYQMGFDQTRELTSVDAYVDLVYSPPQQQQPPQAGWQRDTRCYYPRIVITRADTAIDAITMELQLLALVQATLFNQNMSWAGAFRPRRGVTGIDTRDIGAIGYEVNLSNDPQAQPKAIDTKANDFDMRALWELITATIHDTVVYSMDIEEASDLGWIHQAFIAAADGNREAYDLIIDAANNLTMGAFSQCFPVGEAICYDDNNRLHLGYYIDENNRKRDLREIDYLAILNLAGSKDPMLCQEWAETWDNTQIPIQIRLEKRANILRSILGTRVHIKGYARRVTFNPKFIVGLSNAITMAGLTITPNNLVQGFEGQVQRGNLQIGQFGLSSSQLPNNLYNYGGGQWGNYNSGFNTGFSGRFGHR